MPTTKCKWSSSCWKVVNKRDNKKDSQKSKDSRFCIQHKCAYSSCRNRRYSILYCILHSRERSYSI